MKKLNKLQINSDKLMNNEELITLKGGYGLNGYCCYCFGGDNPGVVAGVTSHYDCDDICSPSDGSWYC